MIISASIIVKNEQDCLRDCLESLKNVVDEIVVTDTGSTDNTVEIAREYTDNVYFFEWQDDFSAAKNYSIGKASGDYVLVIDADEVIAEPGEASAYLRKFTESHEPGIAGIVKVISTTGTGREAQEAVDLQPRFFHRDSFHYQGSIHEQLVIKSGVMHMEDTGVSFNHSGYTEAVASTKNKFARNKKLLLTEIENHPDDEYLLYQLGQAHFSVKKYEEAAQYFERALDAIDFSQPKTPTGIQGYVAVSILTDLPVSLAYSYVNTGRTEDAIKLLETHKELAHPGTASADFDHALGYVYLMLGNIAKSRTAFMDAMAKGEATEKVLGTGSFSSLYHLGLLCEAEQDLNGAMNRYLEALHSKPSWLPVVCRCIDFITEYDIMLPGEIFTASDKEVFIGTYLDVLSSFIVEDQINKAGLLIRCAGSLSAELLNACKSKLQELETP